MILRQALGMLKQGSGFDALQTTDLASYIWDHTKHCGGGWWRSATSERQHHGCRAGECVF